MYAFHCHKLVPTLSLRPLAHPISGFDAYYPKKISHRSQHEILVTFDVGLIVMAFHDS